MLLLLEYQVKSSLLQNQVHVAIFYAPHWTNTITTSWFTFVKSQDHRTLTIISHALHRPLVITTLCFNLVQTPRATQKTKPMNEKLCAITVPASMNVRFHPLFCMVSLIIIFSILIFHLKQWTIYNPLLLSHLQCWMELTAESPTSALDASVYALNNLSYLIFVVDPNYS